MANSNVSSVLIVDEHILFREGLALLLNSLPDFSVIGQIGIIDQATDEACQLKPDIILMDVEFSDGCGTDAIKPILSRLPHTKIVMLSMHESDRLLFTSLQLGAKGYLLKNISFSALATSIRALVRGEAALSRSLVSRVLDEFTRLKVNGQDDHLPMSLTLREQEVVQEVALGNSNREIAHRLSITENTVKRHIHSILKKLSLRNRREIMSYARKWGG